jgi:hypothetical protein
MRKEERMAERQGESTRASDPTTTVYDDVPVAGDRVERLMREIFGAHWASITAGPIIEGSAWEIRFAAPPRVSMLDGYLTVDTGPWHFHLCVNDHRGASPALGRIRRVGRAAFLRTQGGTCTPGSWGFRLWNGRGEQMITVFFPSPFLDDDLEPLREPRWERTALWEDLRRRYAGADALRTADAQP